MKKPLQIDKTNEPLQAARSSRPAVYKKGFQESGDADSKLPEKFRTVSLKSIAELLDTTRSSARRWLKEAGIRPVALSRGAKGAIRYKWKDIEAWLNTLVVCNG